MPFSFEDSLLHGEEMQKMCGRRPFCTTRQPKPGKEGRVRAYRQRWYHLPPSLRRQLWAAYGNDRERYYLSYQPTDEDFKYFQEEGMEYSRKMERKAFRQPRFFRNHETGVEILQSFGAALGRECFTGRQNIILLVIDFEGAVEKMGISEMGVARITSDQIISSKENDDIRCENYNWRRYSKRKFLFGEPIRMTLEGVAGKITAIFEELKH